MIGIDPYTRKLWWTENATEYNQQVLSHSSLETLIGLDSSALKWSSHGYSDTDNAKEGEEMTNKQALKAFGFRNMGTSIDSDDESSDGTISDNSLLDIPLETLGFPLNKSAKGLRIANQQADSEENSNSIEDFIVPADISKNAESTLFYRYIDILSRKLIKIEIKKELFTANMYNVDQQKAYIFSDNAIEGGESYFEIILHVLEQFEKDVQQDHWTNDCFIAYILSSLHKHLRIACLFYENTESGVLIDRVLLKKIFAVLRKLKLNDTKTLPYFRSKFKKLEILGLKIIGSFLGAENIAEVGKGLITANELVPFKNTLNFMQNLKPGKDSLKKLLNIFGVQLKRMVNEEKDYMMRIFSTSGYSVQFDSPTRQANILNFFIAFLSKSLKTDLSESLEIILDIYFNAVGDFIQDYSNHITDILPSIKDLDQKILKKKLVKFDNFFSGSLLGNIFSIFASFKEFKKGD